MLTVFGCTRALQAFLFRTCEGGEEDAIAKFPIRDGWVDRAVVHSPYGKCAANQQLVFVTPFVMCRTDIRCGRPAGSLQ